MLLRGAEDDENGSGGEGLAAVDYGRRKGRKAQGHLRLVGSWKKRFRNAAKEKA